VNGGGGGGGGVESDGGWFASGGLGGSFIEIESSGDFDPVRRVAHRQAALESHTGREERPRYDRCGAQFRTGDNPSLPTTSPLHRSL
jgi:hypothetical protein